jgi:hypothetical protein
LSSAAESAKDAAFDAAADAKSALRSGFSALPNSTATVADQNADVRGLAENYRDPAGAIQQDKAAGGSMRLLAICAVHRWQLAWSVVELVWKRMALRALCAAHSWQHAWWLV